LNRPLCEGLSEVKRARRGLGFGRANALHLGEVALRIGLILIVRQELGTESDALVERPLRRLSTRILEAGSSDDALQIVRGQAPPGERQLIHLDRRTVEVDRLHDRLQRQRDRAALERKAEHEGVGSDAVAHQRGGKPGRIQNIEVGGADGLVERLPHRSRLEIDVGVDDEACRRQQIGVDDRARHAALGPA
jgi:hypothetical protein